MRALLLVGAAAAFAFHPLAGQQIAGRVLDAATGAPVPTAGVFLLSETRDRLAVSLADSVGRFTLDIPGPGSYYLYAQRIGYFQTESPLFAVASDRTYPLDLELRPEPIAIGPLTVTVRNEEMEGFLRLRLGVNPNSIFGYRAIQGARLEEAKLKSEDNTELLRWLYVPVSHGRSTCVGPPTRGVDRGSSLTVGDPNRSPGRILDPECGPLYVDGHPLPPEHIDSIEMQSIAVVVVLPPSIHLYTRTFDWTERPRR